MLLRVGLGELRQQWEDALAKNRQQVKKQMEHCTSVLSQMQHAEHEAMRRTGVSHEELRPLPLNAFRRVPDPAVRCCVYVWGLG